MIERKSLGIKYFAVLIGFLRDRQAFLEEIRHGVRLQSKISLRDFGFALI